MNKTLGICIPYYKNSEECEIRFKELMECLLPQLTSDMILYVYEDGQVSDWLWEIKNDNMMLESNPKNKGVSHARNRAIDYLIDKVEYILFIDSDDMVEKDYLTRVREYCADRTHDIIETAFYIQGQFMRYNPKEVRSCAASSAIRINVIGDHRFDENRQIGEDTHFMNDIVDLSKYRKKYCPTEYYYRLGTNPNSLIKRYERKEIGEFRNGKKRNTNNK